MSTPEPSGEDSPPDLAARLALLLLAALRADPSLITRSATETARGSLVGGAAPLSPPSTGPVPLAAA